MRSRHSRTGGRLGHGLHLLVIPIFLYLTASLSHAQTLSSRSQPDSSSDDKYWDQRFAARGADDYSTVSTIVANGDDVYFGGGFDAAGTTFPPGVVHWNRVTKRWSDMPGLVGMINALTIWRGDLVAVGSFTFVDTVNGKQYRGHAVARWDGSAWRRIGLLDSNETARFVTTMGDTLVVGGGFDDAESTQSIFMFDGTAWSHNDLILLGDRSDWITGMASVDGALYVAVIMDSSYRDDHSYAALARWSKNVWSDIGRFTRDSTPRGDISVLAAGRHALYVGGKFTGVLSAVSNSRDTTVMARNIVKLNTIGGTWEPLGDGVSQPIKPADTWNYDYVSAIATDNEDVYVGGMITRAGSSDVQSLAKWDGRSWSPLAAGSREAPVCMALAGNDLIAAGMFTVPPDMFDVTPIIGLHLDTREWYPLYDSTAQGVPSVEAIAASDSALFASSHVHILFPENTGFLRSWTEDQGWQRVSHSTPDHTKKMNVPTSLALDGSYLYAGGDFTSIGGVTANGIARLDPATGEWDGLNGGFFAPDSGWVTAIRPAGSSVFVAGHTGTVDRIARWNESSWEVLPGAFDGPILCMTVIGNDLYVGGMFNSIDDLAVRNIARWNTLTRRWYDVGGGVRDTNRAFTYGQGDANQGAVKALVAIDGVLYVGGRFRTAGILYSPEARTPAGDVARWDGMRWENIGDVSRNGEVFAMAARGDELFIAGDFNGVGESAAHNVAVWSAQSGSWSQLGSGIDGVPHAIAVNDDGVFFAGDIEAAGGHPSVGVARWTRPAVNGEAPVGGADEAAAPTIVPNPLRDGGAVHVRLSRTMDVHIEITDLLGRRVSATDRSGVPAGEQAIRFSIEGVPAGAYFCRLSTADGQSLIPFVLLH